MITLKPGQKTAAQSSDIEFDALFTDIRVDSVKQLYQEIAHMCASICPIEAEDTINALMRGDQNTISALGDGMAYPNFKSDKISKDVTVLIKLHDALEMDTADGEPVKIVVLIISPEMGGSHHLQRLSKIVRMFKDKDLRANLGSAQNLDELQAILQYQSLRQQAA